MTTGQTSIEVEVIGLALDGGRLEYRRRSAAIGAQGATPDAVAAELGRVPTGRGVVCHSTSWRWEPAGPRRAAPTLVLTYAVVPDPLAWGTGRTAGESTSPTPVGDAGIVCSPHPEAPTPPGLHEHHVVAHAVRHLADLARRDPTVARAAQRHPEVWDAVLAHAADVTVAEHPDLPPHAATGHADGHDAPALALPDAAGSEATT